MTVKAKTFEGFLHELSDQGLHVEDREALFEFFPPKSMESVDRLVRILNIMLYHESPVPVSISMFADKYEIVNRLIKLGYPKGELEKLTDGLNKGRVKLSLIKSDSISAQVEPELLEA